MDRWFKALGLVLAVALLVATGAPLTDRADADGQHHLLGAVSQQAPADSHHDEHQGLCAAVCVAPLVVSSTVIASPADKEGITFYPADEWALSHSEDGPEKPPRA